MMEYYVYRLKFDTPVHFGAAHQGGKLEQSDYTLSSDTLFSAICCELAQHGEDELLAEVIEKNKQGSLLFSGLFPYKETNKGTAFYLPKPVMYIEPKNDGKGKSLQEIRQQATIRKKQKKVEFIRAGNLNQYMSSLRNGTGFTEENDFGTAALTEKVNCREEEPLPYYVGSFSFYENSGLYLLVGDESKKNKALIDGILTSLGISGIGGKRSSGYGKFSIIGSGERLSEIKTSDGKVLLSMLNSQSEWYMSMSSVIPEKDDMAALKDSQYKLIKRSGFITPLAGESIRKKNSIFAIAAGSCLKAKITGAVAELGESNGHAVLRSGKGLYVGLPL